MQLVETQTNLSAAIRRIKEDGKTVGFVPTMGALHKGHLSLVKEAKKTTDFVVVSIFVNPTQFNDKSDLEKYPRTLDADLALLQKVNCDLVFVPSEQEIYPKNETAPLNIDLGVLNQVMEGKHRPGHFEGVAQVVYRLFSMVQPDKSFFGQKDFQQVAVIRAMAQQMNCTTEIIASPTVREADGLAMSSRNVRLAVEHRNEAPLIAEYLFEAKSIQTEKTVTEVEQYVKKKINSNPLFKLEYFEIVDKNTLLPANNWNTPNGCVACIAVWAGDVRLIDNIQF